MEARRTWVVRAGSGGEFIQTAESRGIIAIGFGGQVLGDCSEYAARAEFIELYRKVCPDDKSWASQAGQVYRFVREIQVGDTVLTPDPTTREVLVGKVTSPYRYDPKPIGDEYPHVRNVEWRGRIPRDRLTKRFRNSLGGLMTVFTVEGYEDEIERLLVGQPAVPDEAEEAEAEQYDFLAETEAKAAEMISDMITRIPWDHFELLVAAVLRTLGYQTKMTRRGPDGGYDIVAHPDALGFEDPRIKVEVKHRKQAMTAQDVRSFRSTIGPNEKGLYVSTGGFTGDARHEPEKAGPPLVLMDRDEFIELLLKNYETLDPEFKAMLPLKEVFIPIEM
jgi:restriction system protein